MAKNSVSDWDTTAANNTDVGGVDLAENSMRPRDVNNAIRTVMAQIKTAMPTGNGIGGALGSTDNVLVRTDGADGTTLQASSASIADDGRMTLTATTSVAFISTFADDGPGAGPTFYMRRTSASPAASDSLGGFYFQGQDSVGTVMNVSGFQAAWTSPTDGAEAGVLALYTVQAGTYASRATIGAGLYMTGATGADKGAGTINATSLYINGVQVGPPGAPVTKTGDFTVAATETWLINNKSGSSCTVTLPTASNFTGRELHFKNLQAQTVVSASSNVVPRNSTSAGTAILASGAGNWCSMVSDGTNWVIMEGS